MGKWKIVKFVNYWYVIENKSGKRGIRTLGELPHTRFPGVPLKPDSDTFPLYYYIILEVYMYKRIRKKSSSNLYIS